MMNKETVALLFDLSFAALLFPLIWTLLQRFKGELVSKWVAWVPIVIPGGVFFLVLGVEENPRGFLPPALWALVILGVVLRNFILDHTHRTS